jgi:hypothetical protein
MMYDAVDGFRYTRKEEEIVCVPDFRISGPDFVRNSIYMGGSRFRVMTLSYEKGLEL